MLDWISSLFDNALIVVVCMVMPIILGWAAWTVFRLFRRQRQGYDEDEFEAKPCQYCGYDLRASLDRCPECGARIEKPDAFTAYMRLLADEWPTQPIRPRIPAIGEPQVVLMSTANEHEAELVREQLMTRGLPCVLQVAEHVTYAGVVRRTSFHRVIIYQEDVTAAQEYLGRVGCPSVLDVHPCEAVSDGDV